MEQLRPETVLEWSGKFIRVLRQGGWEYVERVGSSGAVAIVAVTPAQELVLIQQFRVPLNNHVIELPAGLAGDTPGAHGEAFQAAARRELLEETGYEATQWTFLTQGPPSAGLATETVAFFLAQDLRRTGNAEGDGHENIQVLSIPLSHIETWLNQRRREGALLDPKIYIGLYFLQRNAITIKS